MLITGGDSAMSLDFKKVLKKMFEMTNDGEVRYFLGFDIHQLQYGVLSANQNIFGKYWEKFHMEKAKSVAIPMTVKLKFSIDVREC